MHADCEAGAQTPLVYKEVLASFVMPVKTKIVIKQRGKDIWEMFRDPQYSAVVGQLTLRLPLYNSAQETYPANTKQY